MSLISLAMIVKNEETTLPHCLESVRPLVDEIIIVDTGSTDKTTGIAGDFGARVYHFEWRDDFAAARNESLKYCKGEWVLILDADEAIDPLDHEKIKNACVNPWAGAYTLITRTYTPTSIETTHDIGAVPNNSNYGEGAGRHFYTDSSGLRLARMFDGLAFSERIHETLGKSLLSHGKAIAALDAVIHHYGKLIKEREEYKSHYYLMLARREFDQNPTDEQAQFNLLQQALVAEQWEVALEAAQASLKSNSGQHPLVLYGSGVALQRLDRHGEALKYFDALLGENPGHAPAILAKGLSFEALGNINMGRRLIMESIEIQPDFVLARARLAELELRVNNLGAAREITLDALDIAPNEAALYDILLKIELAGDNHKQAVQIALRGIQMCPGGGEGRWHRLAAVYLHQAGERGTARSVLELGLKTFPNDPDMLRLIPYMT